MAFLYEEDRGLTNIKDPYPHIGPGTYNSETVAWQQTHGYAPFLSTGERVQPLVSKQRNVIPGPGAYEVSKPLGDSGVQAYMNKSTIIVKVQGNGTSVFRSNQDRFKVNRHTTGNSPGPGAYDWQPSGGRGFGQKTDVPQQAQLIEDIRVLNNQRKNPTIPQTSLQVGKVFQDIEALANHQQAAQMTNNVGYHVGPGSYEIPETLQKNKGISWGKQVKQRFVSEKSSSVGPGKYNVNKRVVPRFKRNASPGFISETVRSHFDQLVYHTNSELKAELRKRTGYKDSEVPGPGQYNSQVEAIKISNKAREFQFFGSSLERFQGKESSQLGPGQYNLNNSFDALHKKKNYVNYSFMSTQNRDDSAIAEQQRPGPGQYYVNTHTLKQGIIKKFTLGYKGSFGSTEKRFDEKLLQSSVGPGKYEVSQIQPQQQNPIGSSAFKSGTQRNGNSDQSKDYPNMGTYDVGQFNISTKINKQANFLKNLKRIDVVKPGFDSGQTRFKEENSVESTQPTQQQGYQSESNIIQQYDSKSIKAPFISKSKRLDQAYQHTPGVGQYSIGQNQWKKQSFNTHYNKLLENDVET